MSNSFPVLGFDIGGTKIAVCLAMSDGKILASGRVDNRMRKPDEVLPDLVKEGKRLLKEAGIAGDQLRAIGIDSPSPMDFEKGLICSPCNMNGWDDVPIRDYLAKEFQTEAFFDNDANGAGLAEWIFGAGQGCKNMLYLTMSTGIGGGIICNGKLVRGSKYLAGEVGHFCLDPHGPKCNCGLTGCYEAFCGGLATANHIREELAKKPELSMITKLVEGDLSKIDNAVLEKAVRAGDDYAVRFWDGTQCTGHRQSDEHLRSGSDRPRHHRGPHGRPLHEAAARKTAEIYLAAACECMQNPAQQTRPHDRRTLRRFRRAELPLRTRRMAASLVNRQQRTEFK